MRVLLTGSTVRASNTAVRKTRKIWNVPETFKDLWEEMGWEVDWRRVEVGEAVDGYDLVVVVQAPLMSMNSPLVLNALWTQLAARRRGVPLITYHEDWRMGPTFSNAKSIAYKIGPRQLYKKIGEGRLYTAREEDVRAHEDDLMLMCKMYCDNEARLWEGMITLVPKFERWGRLEVMGAKMPVGDSLRSIDPTPLIMHWTDHPLPEEAKARDWVLAALPDHTPWLVKEGLGGEGRWPVRRFGCRPLKEPKLETEDDVFLEYAKHWGVLSPPYYHAGSGWARARTVFAALAGSILWMGEADAAMMGAAYQVKPAEVEAMGEGALAELAAEQRAWILPRLVTDKQETAAAFERLAAEAKERALWARPL